MKVSDATKGGKSDLSASRAGGKSGGSEAVRAPGGVQAPAFTDVVEDIETRQLIDEIEAIGAQLSRFPTLTMMARYRELVRAALDKARSGVRLKRDFKWRRTERSMFVTIERTEEALEEIEALLGREADRTRMFELVEEIKGCLISLLF
ncbi:hypothetical protein FACS1894216_13850 [Synergistales bacterium]|nr:hypothetical protein FACS1894216_13850 [Synergistales bacterium]